MLSAQSFDHLIELADSLYEVGNYGGSAKNYDQAFKLAEGNATQYYNAACSHALSGNQDQAMSYLSQAADKGWLNASHIQRDQDLVSLRETSGWQEVLDKVQANLGEYEKDFNKPLQEQLEAIYIKDQTLRQLFQPAQEKFGHESAEMDYFRQLVGEQDSINEAEVLAIIDKHGWPGTSEVGGRANIAVWLVIQHAPIETQEKYLPLLKKSVAVGESQGSHLAMLEDRILMRQGKPQVYGSQVLRDEETGKYKLHEIQDPEYVNQRRRSVGLGPLEENVKRWGIEWTVEQKER